MDISENAATKPTVSHTLEVYRISYTLGKIFFLKHFSETEHLFRQITKGL